MTERERERVVHNVETFVEHKPVLIERIDAEFRQQRISIAVVSRTRKRFDGAFLRNERTCVILDRWPKVMQQRSIVVRRRGQIVAAAARRLLLRRV